MNTGFGASTATSGFGTSSNTMQSPFGTSTNTAQNTGSIFGQGTNTTSSSSGTTGAPTFDNPFTPTNTSQSKFFATPFDNNDMGYVMTTIATLEIKNGNLPLSLQVEIENGLNHLPLPIMTRKISKRNLNHSRQN